MKAEYINPFIRSLSNTFSTMLNSEVKRGDLCLPVKGETGYPISGVIGLSGKTVGTVVIEMTNEVALGVASTMLMDTLTTVDDDVLDAVGELANMVAGAAKAEFEEFELSVSLPNIILGESHEIHWPNSCQPLCVPFETEFGPLKLLVGLAEIAVAADC